ncbi:MAG TPA: neutral zinc metallopeptidase [Pseudonocardiaceae bacterium]
MGGAASQRRQRVGVVLFLLVGLATALVVAHEREPDRWFAGLAAGGRPSPADNPLRDGFVVAPTDCSLPVFAENAAALPSYYEALTTCLDAVWRPVLRAAGLPAERPALVAAAPPPGRCARPDPRSASAWYCGANRTMYLPPDRLMVGTGNPDVHLGVVAHEYGHHVQLLAGVMDAVWANAELRPAGPELAVEESRRLELQATCLAGLFLGAVAGHGSVSRELAERAVHNLGHGEAATTHGGVRSQTFWAERGYTWPTTAACDTWTARPDEVSYR